MDQIRIGKFLKGLRNERGLTQEQMAEQFNISERTVSRWETGSNMPDIGMLVELAEFFDVSITEIIDGERKGGEMDWEEKEALTKVADYSEYGQNVLMKRVLVISITGLSALLLALLFESFDLAEINPLLMCIESICFGLAVGALITCIFFSAGILGRIRNNSRSRKIACILRILCPIIVAACIVACIIITVLNP